MSDAEIIENLRKELAELREKAEIRWLELMQKDYQVQHLVKVLSGIHALLSPPDIQANGQTFRFHYPSSLPADEVLRHLSKAIRAIPDEIEKASQIEQKERP